MLVKLILPGWFFLILSELNAITVLRHVAQSAMGMRDTSTIARGALLYGLWFTLAFVGIVLVGAAAATMAAELAGLFFKVSRASRWHLGLINSSRRVALLIITTCLLGIAEYAARH
jgi:hypothetical protein